MRHFQCPFDQVHSVFTRQPQIRQHNIDVFAFEDANRAADIFGDVDVVFVFKQTPQTLAGVLLVIDNKNRRLHVAVTTSPSLHSLPIRERCALHRFDSRSPASSMRTRCSLKGRRIVSVRPLFCALSMASSPPYSRTIRRTMSKPRPVPRSFVV